MLTTPAESWCPFKTKKPKKVFPGLRCRIDHPPHPRGVQRFGEEGEVQSTTPTVAMILRRGIVPHERGGAPAQRRARDGVRRKAQMGIGELVTPGNTSSAHAAR